MTSSVLDMFAGPHCAVCETAARAGNTYLKGVMNEGVNDPVLRGQWRRAGGLCAEHWRVWRSLDTPALSSAVLTRDLLASRLADGGQLACPACGVAAAAKRRAFKALEAVKLPRSAVALENMPGFLCLAHLRELRNEPLRQYLHARLESLLDELDEFVRLSDYRFANESMGSERDSWLRAIRALGGRV